MEGKASYTAAEVFPYKLLLHVEKIKVLKAIPPVHVQLCPTNKCTLNCKFCSCGDREKDLELPFGQIREIMTDFVHLGCKAVTITGGGEPLFHPSIERIVKLLRETLSIDVGLVTNGTLLNRFGSRFWNRVMWCRISSSDDRPITPKYKQVLLSGIKQGRHVDWAFSHVVTRSPNLGTIESIVAFANDHNFTHIRLVSDLLDLEKAPDLSVIKEHLQQVGVDDSKVIYQSRQNFTRGTKKCLISLLKPVIAPDGLLYPCCGSQYAEKEYTKNFGSARMVMGSYKDINNIWAGQINFDGSSCVRCYYENYNTCLNMLSGKFKHTNHV